jgi:organic radical activating enzyme
MEHYCKSPWMSLFVYDDGRVKSCCAGNWDWGDLKEQSLDEIINSEKVQKLKQDIIDGVPNDYCSYCAGCEKDAGDSQRTYFIQPDRFHMTNEQLSNPAEFELKMVDIRWNSLCQLNCVYCDTLWSTSWAQAKGYPIKSIKSRYYDSVIARVNQDKNGIESIIMGGGEPLLHKQNVELLQTLNNSLSIDIMTNLSMNLDSTSVFTELKKKDVVNWCVSIENVGDRFEYVRHSGKYSQIRENIDKVLQIPNHQLTLFGTYNIHSATRLKEYYQLANEIKRPIHWQPLIHPMEHSVSQFSKPVKELCIQHITELYDSLEFKEYCTHQNQDIVQHSKNFLNHVAEELSKDDPVTGVVDLKFRRKCAEFHVKYKNSDVKSFRELWPELDNIIGRN